MTNIFAGMQVV